MTDACSVAHNAKEKHLDHTGRGKKFSSFCGYCRLKYKFVKDGQNNVHIGEKHGTKRKSLCGELTTQQKGWSIDNKADIRETLDCEKCLKQILEEI